MVHAEVRVEGAKELEHTLDQASGDLEHLRDANLAAARIAAAAASARAPRVSGMLAASVEATADDHAGSIGSRLVYANPIHWGWPARNIAANPFITEGAQSSETHWVDSFQDAVQKILNRVKGA